jgi:hypothetical protein
MTPRKLSGEHPESERRRWRVIRADTMQELPGEILSADADSGACVLKQSNGEAKDFSLGAGGLIIAGRAVLLLFAALTLNLTACSELGKFTEGDLSNASALANAGGDPGGAACWAGLAPAAAASPMPATDGIAVVAERDRLLHAAVQGPCGAVVAPALLSLLSKALPVPF